MCSIRSDLNKNIKGFKWEKLYTRVLFDYIFSHIFIIYVYMKFKNKIVSTVLIMNCN